MHDAILNTVPSYTQSQHSTFLESRDKKSKAGTKIESWTQNITATVHCITRSIHIFANACFSPFTYAYSSSNQFASAPCIPSAFILIMDARTSVVQEGATGWEKLKNYVKSFQESVGKTEVDNVGIDEYGPHTVGSLCCSPINRVFLPRSSLAISAGRLSVRPCFLVRIDESQAPEDSA